MTPERILVLNITGIGDFVDSTAALRALRRIKPDAHITLTVAEKVLPLAESCPHADAVIGLPTVPGRGVPSLAALPRWLGVVLPLRRRFSLVLNLYEVSSITGSWWLRLLLQWLRAPVTIGQNTKGRAPFYTRSVPDEEMPHDNVEGFLRVVSCVPGAEGVVMHGGADSVNRLELWIPNDRVSTMRVWLEGLPQWGDLTGPYVAVAMGGDRQTRHELPERAGQWLRTLQDEFAIRPFVWGTARDPLPRHTEGLRCVDLRGRFDLVHAVALIAAADAVIATQSAAQHLVSVWGIPTIVLGGPADPLKHRPHLPADRLRILYDRVECSPCFYQRCPWRGEHHKQCLHHISVAMIQEAFCTIWTGRRRGVVRTAGGRTPASMGVAPAGSQRNG